MFFFLFHSLSLSSGVFWLVLFPYYHHLTANDSNSKWQWKYWWIFAAGNVDDFKSSFQYFRCWDDYCVFVFQFLFVRSFKCSRNEMTYRAVLIMIYVNRISFLKSTSEKWMIKMGKKRRKEWWTNVLIIRLQYIFAAIFKKSLKEVHLHSHSIVDGCTMFSIMQRRIPF